MSSVLAPNFTNVDCAGNEQAQGHGRKHRGGWTGVVQPFAAAGAGTSQALMTQDDAAQGTNR